MNQWLVKHRLGLHLMKRILKLLNIFWKISWCTQRLLIINTREFFFLIHNKTSFIHFDLSANNCGFLSILQCFEEFLIKINISYYNTYNMGVFIEITKLYFIFFLSITSGENLQVIYYCSAQNLSGKLGQQSAMCWNSLGLFRDYGLNYIFFRNIFFCFSR